MKVMVTGAGGQLGRELLGTAPGGVECVPLSRTSLDIGDADAVAQSIDSHCPSVLINAAAYTAVDGAESEPALAIRANGDGPANLARACRERGCRLLHLSTDFVFDGRSGRPYAPDAAIAPLGEYGRSKALGESAVTAAAPASVILRTGWVYSRHGGNFVLTMLRLMAEREELRVVCDQVGTPTWARGLALALWEFAGRDNLSGIYHWSDAGACSWYDFAVAINEEALGLGLLERPTRIVPIPASEYPTPAERPAFSVLDKSSSWRDLELPPEQWRRQLRAMLSDMKENTP